MSVAIASDGNVDELAAMAASAPSMAGSALAAGVSTTTPYESLPQNPVGISVVAYDLGIKRDIIGQLNDRGVSVTVVPWDTPSNDVLAMQPDGVFLSNGPGDPEPLEASVSAVRDLLGSVPVFGICLGHQILGLALGAETFKLPFGHHGGNHPVRNVSTGRVDITSQNHGFAVDMWSLGGHDRPEHEGLAGAGQVAPVAETRFGSVESTHQNLNDGTNEGLRCLDIDAFSVQYHPEAAPGPNDALALFDDFVTMIGGERAQAH
jgi:carbamoyl-phosphate synthase small subunit